VARRGSNGGARESASPSLFESAAEAVAFVDPSRSRMQILVEFLGAPKVAAPPADGLFGGARGDLTAGDVDASCDPSTSAETAKEETAHD
jgi:hypothetical protein